MDDLVPCPLCTGPTVVARLGVSDEMVERAAEWFSRERYRSRVYDVDRDRARQVLAVAFQDNHQPEEGTDA